MDKEELYKTKAWLLVTGWEGGEESLAKRGDVRSEGGCLDKGEYRLSLLLACPTSMLMFSVPYAVIIASCVLY